MLKSSIKSFLVILIILSLSIVWVLYNSSKNILGKKVFPQKDITYFSINDIEFAKKEDFWHIKNFNDYYANPRFISSILYMFENATYSGEQTSKKPYYKLKVKNKEYKTTGFDIKHKNQAQKMSVGINLYEQGYKYLANPLIKIASKNAISKLLIDDIHQKFIGDDFIKDINSLYLIDVSKTISVPQTKIIEITFITGLIASITYYKDDWYSIEYKTTRIHQKSAAKLAFDSNILTKGWYFKLVSSK